MKGLRPRQAGVRSVSPLVPPVILHDCALKSSVIEKSDILVEAKTFSTHKAAKVGAQGFSVLARLVLGPAVKRCLAPTIAIPLTLIWSQLFSAPIVCVNLGGKIVRAVFIFDHRGAKREAWRDLAGLCRPADTQSRDRNDATWQLQQIAYDSRMIADGADWTAAEPDCLRGADKCRERDRRVDDRIEE